MRNFKATRINSRHVLHEFHTDRNRMHLVRDGEIVWTADGGYKGQCVNAALGKYLKNAWVVRNTETEHAIRFITKTSAKTQLIWYARSWEFQENMPRNRLALAS